MTTALTGVGFIAVMAILYRWIQRHARDTEAGLVIFLAVFVAALSFTFALLELEF